VFGLTRKEIKINDANKMCPIWRKFDAERRGKAARYQQALYRHHQRHVQPRSLQVGDLTLLRFQSHDGMNKLSPTWEGPFRATEEHRPGVFRLTDKDGMQVPNVWNIEHLHKFYP